MPTKGTTRRSIRCEDDLWQSFQAATHAAGVNASETIRGLIRDWLDNQTIQRDMLRAWVQQDENEGENE